ncbi:metalloregulator ArsR/SmtB family transcription factor [Actinoplanes sp. Pm04-4]|uniref:Metalloregulator ArsR/SmtB family transcription factor n=1 Tax=Paractinoplanes pyxinae TaxID=2997416 RepID=A0ABT4BGG3_9ACTN|nr:metalloregulator ArsR/SmtB family transcription factor [Actinoplanes pyxinae]MCY1145629.1 metalloregulator ArsR/SmtB family transcription factor [Actinoplanes pyxinae]
MSKSGVADQDAACCPPMTQQRLDPGAAADLSVAFKALGDPVRLQLMSMIASAPDGEICVCDLTPAFAVSGPTISHHLKTLREAGLVDAERRASWVYYRPRPGVLRQLSALLNPDES